MYKEVLVRRIQVMFSVKSVYTYDDKRSISKLTAPSRLFSSSS